MLKTVPRLDPDCPDLSFGLRASAAVARPLQALVVKSDDPLCGWSGLCYVVRDEMLASRDGRPSRVLNLGAGRETWVENTLDYLGAREFVADRIDVEPCGVDHPNVGAVFTGSIENMPQVPSETYSIAFASYVLEHIAHLPAALAEINRVLSPTGLFIATVPNTRAPEFLLSRHTPHRFHDLFQPTALETEYAYRSIGHVTRALRLAGITPTAVVYAPAVGTYVAQALPSWRPVLGLAHAYDDLVSRLRLRMLCGDVVVVGRKTGEPLSDPSSSESLVAQQGAAPDVSHGAATLARSPRLLPHSFNGLARAIARPRYRHVISLGYFCSTALELQRYGLRDHSYPLDWNISSIRSALALLESGFDGFLQLDRLSPEPGYVRDTESGILVYNDFDPARSIAEQYEVVRERYERRIERLRRAIMEPTIFVRYIDSEGLSLEEFSYLDENMPAVLALLRRTNPLNDLLLVGDAALPPTCGGLHVYRVAPDEGDVVARKFLQRNPELRRSLIGLDYPLGLRARNLLRYWFGRSFRRVRRYVSLRTRLRDFATIGTDDDPPGSR